MNRKIKTHFGKITALRKLNTPKYSGKFFIIFLVLLSFIFVSTLYAQPVPAGRDFGAPTVAAPARTNQALDYRGKPLDSNGERQGSTVRVGPPPETRTDGAPATPPGPSSGGTLPEGARVGTVRVAQAPAVEGSGTPPTEANLGRVPNAQAPGVAGLVPPTPEPGVPPRPTSASLARAQAPAVGDGGTPPSPANIERAANPAAPSVAGLVPPAPDTGTSPRPTSASLARAQAPGVEGGGTPPPPASIERLADPPASGVASLVPGTPPGVESQEIPALAARAADPIAALLERASPEATDTLVPSGGIESLVPPEGVASERPDPLEDLAQRSGVDATQPVEPTGLRDIVERTGDGMETGRPDRMAELAQRPGRVYSDDEQYVYNFSTYRMANPDLGRFTQANFERLAKLPDTGFTRAMPEVSINPAFERLAVFTDKMSYIATPSFAAATELQPAFTKLADLGENIIRMQSAPERISENIRPALSGTGNISAKFERLNAATTLARDISPAFMKLSQIGNLGKEANLERFSEAINPRLARSANVSLKVPEVTFRTKISLPLEISPTFMRLAQTPRIESLSRFDLGRNISAELHPTFLRLAKVPLEKVNILGDINKGKEPAKAISQLVMQPVRNWYKMPIADGLARGKVVPNKGALDFLRFTYGNEGSRGNLVSALELSGIDVYKLFMIRPWEEPQGFTAGDDSFNMVGGGLSNPEALSNDVELQTQKLLDSLLLHTNAGIKQAIIKGLR